MPANLIRQAAFRPSSNPTIGLILELSGGTQIAVLQSQLASLTADQVQVLLRIGIQRDLSAGVIAIADMNIRNAAGNVIAIDNPSAVLTSGEVSALQLFLTRELGRYESTTGLTAWVPPSEDAGEG